MTRKNKKENKALKKILIICVATLVLAVIITSYLYSHTSSSPITENESTTEDSSAESKNYPGWKIYENKNLKFTFDYPSKLSEMSDKLPKEYMKDTVSDDNLVLQSSDQKSSIRLFLNPRMDGGCWPYYRYTADQSGDKITYVKKLDENYSTNREGCVTFYTLELYKTDGNYFIGYYRNDNSKDPTEFEKILNSFRFTK